MVEKVIIFINKQSVIRSFEVTNSQQAQTILAENSNLRKNKIVFEVNK